MMEFLLFILMLSVPYISTQKAPYTITAPNTIRRNSDYQVAVTNHNSSENVALEVTVKVIGQAANGGQQFSADGVISVPSENTRILTLKIGNWEPGNYRLLCNGKGAATFAQSIPLAFNNKEFSILIQMDKSKYEPGQTVHFRIVSFNSNLLPLTTGTLSVHISDGDGNRIKQWDVPVPKNGIFSNELQLSPKPVLGNWILNAKISNVEASSKFLVSKTSYSKFDVAVIPPPFITLQDDVQFSVIVTALFTNGSPVSGRYVVNVTETSCNNGNVTVCPSRPIVLTGSFRGTERIRVRIDDLKLSKSIHCTKSSLTIVATVTDDSTDNKRNNSAIVPIYQSPRQLVVDQPAVFKPQTSHNFTVKLLRQNGAPISPCSKRLINITVNYDDDSQPVELSGEFNDDGTFSDGVIPPAGAQSLSITVLYEGILGSGYASSTPSRCGKSVSISVVEKNPKVGDNVTVKVTSTFQPSGPFSYRVIGRGAILIARTSSDSDSQNLTSSSNSFSFLLTRNMAPRVRILCFSFSDDGEIVSDSLDISVDGVLQNPVTLTLSSNTTEPGNKVTVAVDCKPDSTVGIMAVDERVLLLGYGQDITEQSIVNELDDYDIGWKYPFDEESTDMIRRPPQRRSSNQLFVIAGLQLLTNGKNTCVPPPIKPLSGIVTRAVEESPGTGLGQTGRELPNVGLWIDTLTNKDGKAEMTYPVPDRMNTWVISALAMNDKDGLGITNVPINLIVTKKFYIVNSVPSFVTENENVVIETRVVNNLPQDLDQVVVTLDKTKTPSAYDFPELFFSNSDILTKRVNVRANSVRVVTFIIRPKVIGVIELNIKAVSTSAEDQKVQKITVKAEGAPQYFSKSSFIDLRNQTSVSTRISIFFPLNTVAGSRFIECSVIGDIMAPVILNIKVLLRLPAGCGEQNLLYFVPDIVIIQYLLSIGQLTAEFNKTAISYLELGYQTQLTFKRPDGSYSAWGKAAPAGSTWLTAYVVKAFSMGIDYITIDPNVIDAAKKFVASKQDKDGQFTEDGVIYHKAMQGGTTIGIARTAFVLIAFIEKQDQNNSAYDEVIQKALKYLEDNLNSANNSYELAITSYALHLTNSTKKDLVFKKLFSRKIDDGDLSYWSYSSSKTPGTGSAYDIETTSYVVLTLSLRPEITIEILLPVVRWLISKRSSLGGYESSQETVMAIQALAIAGLKFPSSNGSSVEVTFNYWFKDTVFHLTKENAMVFQKVQFPDISGFLTISATGNGVGIAQCIWNYNVVNSIVAFSDFIVVAPVSSINTKTYSVNIRVSAREPTNMVLVEFDCISGYELVTDDLPVPGSIPKLTIVETSNENTHANFYFDNMVKSPDSVTIIVKCFKVYEVSRLKDAMIKIYDYSEPSKRAEVFYKLLPIIG